MSWDGCLSAKLHLEAFPIGLVDPGPLFGACRGLEKTQ